MSRRSDQDRLEDILDHALGAIDAVKGHQNTDLETDRNFRLLVERYIEIIGEAAARVSDQTKTQLPGVQWENIIGMRNILIHGYFDIDLDILWETAVSNLPALVLAIRSHLDS